MHSFQHFNQAALAGNKLINKLRFEDRLPEQTMHVKYEQKLHCDREMTRKRRKCVRHSHFFQFPVRMKKLEKNERTF